MRDAGVGSQMHFSIRTGINLYQQVAPSTWFARIERDVIARGVFSSVSDLARKLKRYIRAYSAHPKPFRWKYSDPTRHIGNRLFPTGH